MANKEEKDKKIKVLIADDIQQTRTDIRRLLYFEEDLEVCGEAENGEEALAAVAKHSPDVVLMDINMPVMDGISATQALSFSHPHVSVVIISIQGEQEYLRKAMVAGARDYLVKPLSSGDMALTIRQCYQSQQRYSNGRPSQNGQGASEVTERKENTRKVISFFGGKGGSGKSFLASNLAVALTRKKLSIALVDLDLQFGDIAVMFNLGSTHTISDLIARETEIDTAQLAGCMVRHASGVNVLAAPPGPVDAEVVTAVHVRQILHCLKNTYDCVILDTAAFLHDITLLVLEESDLIFIPVRRDIATIKNARASLDLLHSLEMGDKVRLLLNQANLDYGIELPELEHSLGNKIYHNVAADERMAVASINRGIPLVMEHGNSEISKDLSRLAEKICSSSPEGAKLPERKVSLGKILSLNFG